MTRCCHNGCAHPVVPGTTRCEKHTKHHRADECREYGHNRRTCQAVRS